jgi:hypothetical protein
MIMDCGFPTLEIYPSSFFLISLQLSSEAACDQVKLCLRDKIISPLWAALITFL